MAASPGSQPPSPVVRRAAGRRRRRRRESPLLWWLLFALLAGAAVLAESWRIALAGLALWCLYEFLLVPGICRIMLRQGHACREPARGRLFACGPEHQRLKNTALLRLAGRRPRPQPLPAPTDDGAGGGVLVHSTAVRGRLARTDRLMILVTVAATAAAVVLALYGLGG
ncbi:hypothetical protein [Actinomadura parmotrematis]|uniref:Uncharacterized protein n=1 Tax=Actinomadura parmotrematis TaxID=2864039 RepID=A0ABS7FZG8_9ACTN|nr:hypothetical protein [Actinomadura parmotrematis]MBW8485340.1 hypothetical protein [Actinomadura parmotrematis]